MVCSVSYKTSSPKCQFENSEDLESANSPITVDGKEWCWFHCPINAQEKNSAKSTWDVTKLSIFSKDLNKIIDKKLQIELGGELDLSNIKFPENYNATVLIEKLQNYNGKVILTECEFYCQIKLEKLNLRNFDFSNSIFFKSFFLDRCTLTGSLFKECKFNEEASFY